MVKFGDVGEATDIFGVNGDRFQDFLYLGVMALVSFVAVLLPSGHLSQNLFDAIKPVVAVGHD